MSQPDPYRQQAPGREKVSRGEHVPEREQVSGPERVPGREQVPGPGQVSGREQVPGPEQVPGRGRMPGPTASSALGMLAAFLLELAVLAAAGYWGFTLAAGLAVRVIAGLGAPALLAFGWGMLAAPRARVILPVWARTAFVTAWFAAGAVALAAAGALWLAIALAAAFAGCKFVLGMWPASGPPAVGQDPSGSPGGRG